MRSPTLLPVFLRLGCAPSWGAAGLANSAGGTGTAHVGTNHPARDDARRRVPEFIDALAR